MTGCGHIADRRDDVLSDGDIQTGRRFVKKNKLRSVKDTCGEGGALAHSRGKPAAAPVNEPTDIHLVNNGPDAVRQFRAG